MKVEVKIDGVTVLIGTGKVETEEHEETELLVMADDKSCAMFVQVPIGTKELIQRFGE